MILLAAPANDRDKERLYGPTLSHVKLFKIIWLYISRHIIINSDGEKDTRKSRMSMQGSLTSATIAANFEPKTDKAVSRAVQLKFSTSRPLHCW